MPQSYPEGKYPMLHNGKLPEKAQFLAMGMWVIANQSAVDSAVSVLLTKLAKGSPTAVAAIYGVLRQGHLQAKALLAVAESSLPKKDLDLLKKIMKIAKESSDLRDSLAHRMWFVDDRIKDAVVLVDPALHWRAGTKIGDETNGKLSREETKALMEDMRAACEIWQMRDLERARHLSVTASILIGMFGGLVTADNEESRTESLKKIEATFKVANGNPGRYSQDLRWT